MTSAVNVVAGRVQDVYNSISAVRTSMMMRALADVGSPIHMKQSQQTTHRSVKCELCEAMVMKRWKIAPQTAGMSESVEQKVKIALLSKMVAEPATWNEELETELRNLRKKLTEPEVVRDEYAKNYPTDA